MNPASVSVRVPATTANLGPGFDAVGMAVSMFATFTVRVHDGGRRPGRLDPMSSMAKAGLRAGYKRAGQHAPRGIDIDVASDIPLGRGLGASAAARGAGVVAANALLGGPLDDRALLAVGARLEGHADNIAPALFGGLQVVAAADTAPGQGNQRPRFQRVPVPIPAGITCAGFSPDFSMPTNETRASLPDTLSRADAVFNSGHAALLVAALATGAWDALDVASEERLHQRPRSRLFPQMFDFFAAARAAGALCAYLSGGGSTILALTTPERAEAVRDALSDAAARFDISGRPFIAAPCPIGATVVIDADDPWAGV